MTQKSSGNVAKFARRTIFVFFARNALICTIGTAIDGIFAFVESAVKARCRVADSIVANFAIGTSCLWYPCAIIAQLRRALVVASFFAFYTFACSRLARFAGTAGDAIVPRAIGARIDFVLLAFCRRSGANTRAVATDETRGFALDAQFPIAVFANLGEFFATTLLFIGANAFAIDARFFIGASPRFREFEIIATNVEISRIFATFDRVWTTDAIAVDAQLIVGTSRLRDPLMIDTQLGNAIAIATPRIVLADASTAYAQFIIGTLDFLPSPVVASE